MGGALAIREPDFEAIVEGDTLRLTGSADASVVDELAALVAELHARLVAAHAPEIAVDIRALEFMAASCFNVLVTWLGTIHELVPDARYALVFRANPAIPWQPRSLTTLSCFATDLVRCE